VLKTQIKPDRKGIKLQLQFCDDTEVGYVPRWYTFVFRSIWSVKDILVNGNGDVIVNLITSELNVKDKKVDIEDLIDKIKH